MLYPDLPPLGSNSHVLALLDGAKNLLAVPAPVQNSWDVSLVFNYSCQCSNASLNIEAANLATLLALCTGWRPGSDLARVLLQHITFITDDGEPPFSELKQHHKLTGMKLFVWRPKEGSNKQVLLNIWQADVSLCPVTCTFNYLAKTIKLRTQLDEQSTLFATSILLFSNAKANKISGWVKETLQKSGIEARSHSTRAISTAANVGVEIENVLKAANWSTASVFYKYFFHASASINHGVGDILLENYSSSEFKRRKISRSDKIPIVHPFRQMSARRSGEEASYKMDAGTSRPLSPKATR